MSHIAPFHEHDASVGYPTLVPIGQDAHEHPLLPPIARIPTEILDTIFMFIHKSSKHSLTIHKSTVVSLFLPLSQVCSHWRKTIHSRPSLWASISISAEFIGALAECRHITKIHLENAGSHQLRIELYASFFALRSASAVDILRMIIPELQRCERFTFYGDWSVLATAAQCNSSFTFPHLRALITNTSLEGIDSVPPTSTFRWFAHALKNAPKLATVDTPSIVPPEAFPCHQLTTVCLMDSNITQIARTLRSCSNLKNLEVQSLLADQDPPPNVVHSSLRELTIDTFQDRLAEIASSFAQISLPELQTFKLVIFRDFEGIRSSILPTSAVIPIIQYFSSSLQKLVLVPRYLTVHRTICRDILQICPDLHSFAMTTQLEADNKSEYILPLIQSLTITDTSQAFLAPKLTELRVHEYGSRMTTDYATDFLDMVESRSAGIRVSRLMDAVLKYSTQQQDSQPELNHINTCISDSSIAERIKLLSRKGIRCAIGIRIAKPSPPS